MIIWPKPLVWLKEVCIEIGGWIECWFEEHKLVRRLLVIWSIYLITLLVLKFIDIMTVIDTATVSGIVAVIGILSSVLAFYVRSRELDSIDPDGD